MAIAPLSYPGYAAPRDLDFSPLAKLAEQWKANQQQQVQQEALAAYAGGDPSALLRSGNMSLAQLYVQDQAKKQAQANADRTFQAGRDDAARAQRNADRSYGLQAAAARRAEADAGKPIFKEITDANGNTSIYRLNRDGTAAKVDLGQPTGMPGTNPKSPFNAALLKEDASRVSGYSDNARLAEEGVATLDQIDSLRNQAFTAPIIGPLAAKVGHPATQALEASTNALALDVAQKMKGSLSDKDIAFVKSQVPTAATGGQAGEAASGILRAGFERTKQRAQFYRTWAESNGNINGADAAWARYVNENPMTVEDKNALGGRKFNPAYNKDFSRYLRGASRQSQAGITQEQFNALPSGSVFTAPDGTQRVKP